MKKEILWEICGWKDRRNLTDRQQKGQRIRQRKRQKRSRLRRRRAAVFCACFLLCMGAEAPDGYACLLPAGDAAGDYVAAGYLRAGYTEEDTTEEAASVETAEAPALSLYALSAVLMDGTSGRILYEKDGYEILPMASTTKIMTCILALEYGNLDDMYQVSSYADSMPAVSLGAETGESYRLEDLLYSLMLESHNDTAVIIAEGIAGSVEAFADLMNQKARDIGAYDTYFITPNGLDATASVELTDGTTKERQHSTTAADLAKILRYCIVESPQAENFLRITRTQSYSFTDRDGKRVFSCYNHNAFLNMMEGALTGKTGFTGKAGYCYVGAVEQDGELYIVALLACGWPNNKTYKWSDMRTLVTYGLEQYSLQNYRQEAGDIRIPVTDGVPDGADPDAPAQVLLKVSETSTEGYELLLRDDEKVEVSIRTAGSLAAPVAQGTVAGTMTYTLNGEIIRTCNLVTAEAVAEKDFPWYLSLFWESFLITDF